MSVKSGDYEASLAEYSNALAAIALLRQHRPYLEMLPSLRRPDESIIPIPLPIVRLRYPDWGKERGNITTTAAATLIPCDLAILMCDPDWKIKTGVEVLLFIHRPQEDFSGLLGRWRQTQVLLDQDYEWLMPQRHQHIFSEGAERIYPLFVIFSETPERIKRGLQGACLPYILQPLTIVDQEESVEKVEG